MDKIPKREQLDARTLSHQMYLSPTLKDAEAPLFEFRKHFGVKYPKAIERLDKDQDVLFTFYHFPTEHWLNIRTTNAIASTFATVHHRTHQTKGGGSRLATLTMVFKLTLEAEKKWRRLNGHSLLAKVIQGATFTDGEMKLPAAA